jgi:hypothetical protein
VVSTQSTTRYRDRIFFFFFFFDRTQLNLNKMEINYQGAAMKMHDCNRIK